MDSPEEPTMSRIDWASAKAKLQNRISGDDFQIVELLAAGKSTPDIAKALGTNRSAIWRRVQKIKRELAG
jgi:DNA-binding NarL/FixJ family response regulator